MPQADPLVELLEELRGLGNRALGQVLGRISQAEQRQILALLDEPKKAEPAFEALAGLSPWLLGRLEAARSRTTKQVSIAMTEATRKALLDAQQLLVKADISGPPSSAKTSPSLISRLFTGPKRRGLAA